MVSGGRIFEGFIDGSSQNYKQGIMEFGGQEDSRRCARENEDGRHLVRDFLPDAFMGPWPQLPLAWLSLIELRAAARATSLDWRSAVDHLQIRLSPRQMDAWLQERILCLLACPRVSFPCTASAVYGILRKVPLRPWEWAKGQKLVELPSAMEHLVDWRPDVRQSSHQTLASFLNSLADAGILTTMEIHKELHITGLWTRGNIAASHATQSPPWQPGMASRW